MFDFISSQCPQSIFYLLQRRTGKDIRAGKNIRILPNGLENFDDYMSESG